MQLLLGRKIKNLEELDTKNNLFNIKNKMDKFRYTKE
jgi:hypothetical protein